MAIRDENGFELFDHDKHTGRTVWRYFDGESWIYRTDYPVAKTLEANAEARAAHQGAKWGGGRRIASIPLNVYFEQLAEAQAQKDDKYLSKWLNDGDNAAFRTFEGRV
jgi:hypothetical protein